MELEAGQSAVVHRYSLRYIESTALSVAVAFLLLGFVFALIGRTLGQGALFAPAIVLLLGGMLVLLNSWRNRNNYWVAVTHDRVRFCRGNCHPSEILKTQIESIQEEVDYRRGCRSLVVRYDGKIVRFESCLESYFELLNSLEFLMGRSILTKVVVEQRTGKHERSRLTRRILHSLFCAWLILQCEQKGETFGVVLILGYLGMFWMTILVRFWMDRKVTTRLTNSGFQFREV